MKLDFTTTAMARADLYAQTLQSFQDNLLGVDWKKCTLYLNIDPLPAQGDVRAVVDVALMHFGQVHWVMAPEASFPAAVKWCWDRPRSRYFFHLEDDWILTQRFDISQMVKALDDDQDLTCVNLRAYNSPPNDTRICLLPGLLRTRHARVLASRLTLDANPEKQLRPATLECPQGGKQAGYYGTCIPESIVLQDIGREWMKRCGYKKEQKIFFTKWVEGQET